MGDSQTLGLEAWLFYKFPKSTGLDIMRLEEFLGDCCAITSWAIASILIPSWSAIESMASSYIKSKLDFRVDVMAD